MEMGEGTGVSDVIEEMARLICTKMGNDPDEPHCTMADEELMGWQQFEGLARAAAHVLLARLSNSNVNAAARIEELEASVAALVEALQEARVELEACWLNHYGENPEGSPIPPHIQKAAEAVVAHGARGKALVARLDGLRNNAPYSIHQLEFPTAADPLGLVCYFESEAKMGAWLAALSAQGETQD